MRLYVFESFCNNCIEIYDLHLALFFSATGLVWKVCLNNNGKHEYRKNLYNFHNELPFLPERMEIKKNQKFVCNIYDKSNYAAQIRTLKQALNHRLILKTVHRVIKFNQKAWLIPSIDINTKLRIKLKIDFEKYYFKRMINVAFLKTIKNVRKRR